LDPATLSAPSPFSVRLPTNQSLFTTTSVQFRFRPHAPDESDYALPRSTRIKFLGSSLQSSPQLVEQPASHCDNKTEIPMLRHLRIQRNLRYALPLGHCGAILKRARKKMVIGAVRATKRPSEDAFIASTSPAPTSSAKHSRGKNASRLSISSNRGQETLNQRHKNSDPPAHGLTGTISRLRGRRGRE
jgi:hypothetical protein